MKAFGCVSMFGPPTVGWVGKGGGRMVCVGRRGRDGRRIIPVMPVKKSQSQLLEDSEERQCNNYSNHKSI